jgi:uncharacterized membrane protein
MKLRIASAVLWFFAGWYAGAYLAEIFAVSTVLGPLLGAVTAGILVGDPLHLIWSPRPRAATPSLERAAEVG